jgi:myo-inositol catabolism protein IolC
MFLFYLQTCGDFVKLAQEQGVRWQKLLQYEHDQRIQLEDMVEQLGKQHSILEKQIRKSLNGAINPASGQEGLGKLAICGQLLQ